MSVVAVSTRAESRADCPALFPSPSLSFTAIIVVIIIVTVTLHTLSGPTPVSAPLYTFLQQQNQSATHFMIGGNIRAMQDSESFSPVSNLRQRCLWPSLHQQRRVSASPTSARLPSSSLTLVLTAYKAAFDAGGHVASHTWSHQYVRSFLSLENHRRTALTFPSPQTTTLSDMQVLGELGWTSQIIFDVSGLRCSQSERD